MKPPSWNALIVCCVLITTALLLQLEWQGYYTMPWSGWFVVHIVLANVGSFAYLHYIMLTDDRLLDVALQLRKERSRDAVRASNKNG